MLYGEPDPKSYPHSQSHTPLSNLQCQATRAKGWMPGGEPKLSRSERSLCGTKTPHAV